MRVRHIALACIILGAIPAFPQAAQPLSKQMQWFSYSGDHALTGRFGIHFDGGFRRLAGSAWQQVQVRPGLNVQINRTVSFGATYAYFRQHPLGLQSPSKAAPEHRLHQQVTLQQALGKKLVLRHRYRLEERFLGSAFSRADERTWDLQYRFRYQLRTDIPLRRAKDERALVYLAIFDEIFLRFQRGVGSAFDQNRIYTGIGYRPNKRESIEVGVFNQRFQPAAGGRLENNVVLWVTLASSRPIREFFLR
ncbi:MAG: DUF2490 domain-containing protein [Bryobacteraceae bacterium]|nr:DUF2490 domain-containing protein [Bryobacteraceae bacterium]